MPPHEETYSIKEMLEKYSNDLKQGFDKLDQRLSLLDRKYEDKFIDLDGKYDKKIVLTQEQIDMLNSHKQWLWGAYTVLTLLGGIIIYLSVMAIDTKIKNAIETTLTNKISNVEYEK